MALLIGDDIGSSLNRAALAESVSGALAKSVQSPDSGTANEAPRRGWAWHYYEAWLRHSHAMIRYALRGSLSPEARTEASLLLFLPTLIHAKKQLSYSLRHSHFNREELRVAKPNYSFEKRQRDLAKKRKKAEKLAKKMEARQAANKSEEKGTAPPAENPEGLP